MCTRKVEWCVPLWLELPGLFSPTPSITPCMSEVKDHLKVLKEAKVQDLSARRLKKLSEENKITWLLAAHGIRTICSVCTVMRSLPVGMTHVQRIRAVARLASVTENEATFMDEFITEECPSLLEVYTSKIAILDFGVIVPDCLQVWGGGGNLSIVLSQVLNNNFVPDFARYYHPATITSPPTQNPV